jgi:hypothetical protein
MNHGLGFFADKQDGCALLSGWNAVTNRE